MKQKQRYFLLAAVIAIVLLGLIWGGWFLQQEQARGRQLGYAAENQYQRNFWELSSSVETLNTQLAQLLVTTSQEQTLLGLSGLWREVYSAINYLGGLPVAMHELENTDLLLSDVAEYSYYLLRKNVLQQQPLSEKDWQQLEDFYRRSKVVREELALLETRILSEDLRLSDLHQADEENAILATFRSIENQIHAFPELELDEGVRKIEPEPRVIAGEQITSVEAVTQADSFLNALGLTHDSGTVEFVSDKGKLPIYGIGYYGDAEDEAIYVEVSQKGGQILQFYQYRPIADAQYTQEDAWEQAQKLLRDLGFPTMALVESTVYDRIADLTIVPKIDGIYIYSDMIKMQIALDDNSLLNYDQTSYATRHYERQLPNPILSKENILQDMNPNFQVEDIHMALITDEYSVNELLTYEVIGTVVDEQFSIFVNAMTGEEIRIVRR